MKKSDYYFWAGFALSLFTPIVASYMIELYLSMNQSLYECYLILTFFCNLCILICGIFLMIVGIIKRHDE